MTAFGIPVWLDGHCPGHMASGERPKDATRSIGDGDKRRGIHGFSENTASVNFDSGENVGEGLIGS
jgi:hypothetical protein